MGDPKPLLTARSVFRHDRLSVQLNTSPPALAHALPAAVSDVAGCHPHTIGLCDIGWETEYLVERALLDALPERPFFSNFRPVGDVPPSPAVDPRCFDAPDVVVAFNSTRMTLVHHYTHAVYQAIAQHFPYTVYRPVGSAPTARFDEAEPTFLGWDPGIGWTDIRGPFPELGLPVVCWGLAPRSTLEFSCDGEPMELIAECRGNAFADQLMTIVLNGTEVGQQAFDGSPAYTCLRVRLPALPGTNKLEFRYRHGQELEPGEPYAVLFRKLVIVPQRAAQ
jgi:hypothetical protein